MSNQRSFYSSMGFQQDNARLNFDEAWFDVANISGKEFQLPNISTLINPQWSDKGNLVFLEDQQPDILDNNYELEMTCHSCAGNEVDPFPLMKKMMSITNSVQTVDPQEGSSFVNHVVLFPEYSTDHRF